MSTTALPSSRPASRSVRDVRSAVLTADRVALAMLALACAALAAVTWLAWGDLGGDTGYDWLAGARTAHGELPYIDYVYYYGPLTPLLLGAVQLITGSALDSAIVVGLVLAVATVGLTYAVARILAPVVPAALAAALTAVAAFGVDNNSYVLPHALSAPMVVALGLVLVLIVWRRASGGSRRWLTAAGLVLGLIALARPDGVIAPSVALGAWLLARALSDNDLRRDAVRDAVAIALPALAIANVAYGAMLTQISLHDLVRIDLFPTSGFTHVLKISAPLTAGSFVELAGRLGLYAVVAAALLGLGTLIDRRGLSARAPWALAIALPLIVLAATLVRPEAVRRALELGWGWIPAGAAVAAIVVARTRRRTLDAEAQVALVLCTLLAVMALKSYAAFFPFPNRWSSQQAVYAMPFAAAFLAWLHGRVLPAARPGAAAPSVALVAALAVASVVLLAGDARRESATVSGPLGSLHATPAEHDAYQPALDALMADSGRDDAVLLAPQMTWAYTLTGRANPLPQLSLLPGALPTAAAERTAIARMGLVRVALIDERSFAIYGASTFGSHDFNPIVGAWLRRTFPGPTRFGGDDRPLDLRRRTS
jgi:hypothetical protein